MAHQSALSPDEIDPATSVLYTPHTVTGLIIGESGTPQVGICLLRLLLLLTPAVGKSLRLAATLTRRPLKRPPFAGVAVLVYSSRAFNPPGPKLAEEDHINHTIRHGLVAAVFVWLGAHLSCK